MDTERALWTEIHKASEALRCLALACNAAMNKYRGIPSAGSKASKELCRFADPSVLQEAYDKGARSLVVASDYALALDRTLSEPILSFSPWICLRHILESCSMCIWMLDTTIDPEERATRSLNVQFEENKHKRTFLRRDLSLNRANVPELTDWIEKADERETQLRLQAKHLGIEEKHDRRDQVLGFGNGPKSITDRIEATLKVTLLDYSLLSPMAHGDTWANLILGAQIKSSNPLEVVSDLSLLHALSLLSDSLDLIAKGLRVYYDLYGYDTAEYSKLLAPVQEQVRQATVSILSPTDQSIGNNADNLG